MDYHEILELNSGLHHENLQSSCLGNDTAVIKNYKHGDDMKLGYYVRQLSSGENLNRIRLQSCIIFNL
jgi:hypothetical protein